MPCNGSSFASSDPPEADTNSFLEVCWGKWHPNHWILAAQKSEAKALYQLGVIRERQRRDTEARRLHEQAMLVTDRARTEWAEKSRWRLEHIPWLKMEKGGG